MTYKVNKLMYFGANNTQICIYWRVKVFYMAQLWRGKVRLIGNDGAANWN